MLWQAGQQPVCSVPAEPAAPGGRHQYAGRAGGRAGSRGGGGQRAGLGQACQADAAHQLGRARVLLECSLTSNSFSNIFILSVYRIVYNFNTQLKSS